MVFRTTLLFWIVALGLIILPMPANAAIDVNNIFTLNMDGSIDVDGKTYIGDTGAPAMDVNVLTDEYSNPPAFSDGTVYFSGKSSDPLGNDEVILVNVGTSYTTTRQFIVEAWVKPDYANWPTTSDNTNGRIYACSWFKNVWDVNSGTGSDTKSIYYRVGPDSSGVDPNYQVPQAGGVTAQYGTVSPKTALDPNKFSHVAIVWSYDPNKVPAFRGNLKYYVDGYLKITMDGTNGYQPLNYLPAFFAIGNCGFSGQNEGNTASTFNFNAGFSGWIDSISLTTFTGTFDGPWQFQLIDPKKCGDLGTEYKKGDLNSDCQVNFEDLALFVTKWLTSNISSF